MAQSSGTEGIQVLRSPLRCLNRAPSIQRENRSVPVRQNPLWSGRVGKGNDMDHWIRLLCNVQAREKLLLVILEKALPELSQTFSLHPEGIARRRRHPCVLQSEFSHRTA